MISRLGFAVCEGPETHHSALSADRLSGPALDRRSRTGPSDGALQTDFRRFDRQGIARRLRIRSDSGARNAAKTAPMVFVAFDLIWMEGRSLADLPWEVRRRQLDDLRLDGPGWQTSPLLDVDTAYSLGAGVVAKRRDSTYQIGVESTNWIDATRG